jgi:hypothetical protein
MINQPFKFALNDQVEIAVSGETGTVLGRAEYTISENNYYIRYRSTDGRAIENWWCESALQLAPKP